MSHIKCDHFTGYHSPNRFVTFDQQGTMKFCFSFPSVEGFDGAPQKSRWWCLANHKRSIKSPGFLDLSANQPPQCIWRPTWTKAFPGTGVSNDCPQDYTRLAQSHFQSKLANWLTNRTTHIISDDYYYYYYFNKLICLLKLYKSISTKSII